MDPLLALISDLYSQITALHQENGELRKLLSEKAGPAPSHAGTLEDPDPRPPMGETRIQHA